MLELTMMDDKRGGRGAADAVAESAQKPMDFCADNAKLILGMQSAKVNY